jgi:hypothetical protein
MHEKAQRKQEFRDLILELVLLFKPHTYCEIGIKKGYVFNYISRHVSRAVAVDIAPFRGIRKGGNTIHYQVSSIDFALKWTEQSNTQIDMLFIDANHQAEYVLADVVALSPFVPEHTGLILLHDTYPIRKELLVDTRCSDAWLAAKYIHQDMVNEFEIVTLPGPQAGLSIIRKAKTHGWMDENGK